MVMRRPFIKFTNDEDKIKDLLTIPLINRSRARVLYELGIRNVSELLSRNPSDLSSDERVKKCDGAFHLQIPLIFNYAKSKVEGKVLVTGVDNTFMEIVNHESYFMDLEHHPNTPIFLYGLMDNSGKVTQIFVDDPMEEEKALKEFLSIISGGKTILVTYASKAADEPVLKKAVRKFGLPPDLFKEVRFYDLFYDVIFTQKPDRQKIFLPIKPITEKTVSDYFGYKKPEGLQIHYGLQALLAYDDYLKKRDEKIKDQILLYNRSDLERIRLIYKKLYNLFNQAEKPSIPIGEVK